MQDLTIIMPSYNKEKYIAEAIDSVLMQKTTYTYKIIVVDDCSTDKTLEIVKKYQNNYPNKFEILTSEINQKLYKNVLRAYEITKSDYFCVLDPDDFWIDENKIQKSLDFLEKNKDFTIYVTNTLKQNAEGKREKWSNNKEADSDFHDYLKRKAILGCTLGSIYRNVIFKNGLPEKMINLENQTCENSFRGDSFRNAIHIHEGKAHSVCDYDAVYRITNEGLWQGSSKIHQDLLNSCVWSNLYRYFDKKYPELMVTADNTFKSINFNTYKDITEQDLTLWLEVVHSLDENKSIIDQFKLSNLKLKYKIFYKCYKFFYKKLHKKGIV